MHTMESIHEKIIRSMPMVDSLYYRLVLLVGKTGSGKTSVLANVAGQLGTSVININQALSNELLELTTRQRSLRLPGILHQIVGQSPLPAVLDNLEILFDRNLKQDPLRLLLGVARNRTVLASWNGTMTDGRLLYAETGHPEYRSYDPVDALIVETGSERREMNNMIDTSINPP